MRFLANLRYNIKSELTKDPYADAGKEGIDKFS
jgi:hypothetical protein